MAYDRRMFRNFLPSAPQRESHQRDFLFQVNCVTESPAIRGAPGGNYSHDFTTLPFDMTTAQFIPGNGPFEVPTQPGGEAADRRPG